ITTDLRITLPSFTFSQGSDTVTYSMKQPYEDYALVADGEIFSVNRVGENTVTGNVYSGKGITVKDMDPTLTAAHKLTINGNYIVTRGDIKAVDTAVLTIGNNIRPLLWADNLKTQTTSSYQTSYKTPTNLIINAVCLVKDDLTLDGRNSNAVLTGAYVGYTGEHTVKGSAIMINGSGSSLNLSGLSSLVLAGRAHVSVEDSILKGISVSDPDINILTGESLAIKSNQRAYLIPGEFIKLVKDTTEQTAMHNPLTQKDLQAGTPDVDIVATTDTSKINYFKYVNLSPNQFKIVAKQTTTGGTDTLRYYYLNFASGKLADEYLVDYLNKYSKMLQNLANFTLGNVTLPMENIVSAGNLMYYNSSLTAPLQYLMGKSSLYIDDAAMDDEIAKKDFSTINNNSVYEGTGLLDKQIRDLTKLHFNLTHYLSPTETTRKLQETDQVVASTALRSSVAQVISEFPLGYSPKSTGFTYYNSLTGITVSNTTESAAKSIVILNGDAQIAANSYFNGFLMASGNVTIGEGATINGIIIAAGGTTSPGNVVVNNNAKVYGRIIAAGDITLKENCTIACTGNTTFDSSLSVNTFLKNLFDTDGQILWKLFINPEVTVNFTSGSTSADLVNISNLVTYENWRKNK
ncbi:MAG: hypothetical protein PHF63_09750, partial [Herbinix sp.]|nr:hypothetical protein [Herbinix sp.]